MRRLLVGGVLTSLLVLALCCSAYGDFKVGGVIGAEFWYDSNEAFVTGDNEINELWMNGSNLLGELNVDYADDTGNLKIHTRIKLDGYEADTHEDWRMGDYLHLRQVHIDWQVNPGFRVRFGKQQPIFSAYAPFEIDGPVHLNNVGNIDEWEIAGFRFDFKLSDSLTLQTLLADPDGYDNEALNAVAGAKEENVIPRIDLGIQYANENMSITPSFTYLTQNYDNITLAGYDDSITIYGASIGAQLNMGPLMFKTDFYYGQNLGDGNYEGANGFFGGLGQATLGADGEIYDATVYGGFIELLYAIQDNFKIGTAIGLANYQNDGAAGDADDTEVTDMSYTFAVHYSPRPQIEFVPQVRIYQFDDGAKVNGAEIDRGSITSIGCAVLVFF